VGERNRIIYVLLPLTQKEIINEIKEIHRFLEELEKRIVKDTGGPAASITHGFLPLTDQQNGVYLGLPSVIMFFLSFGFAFRIKARLTTALLITGGTLLAVSKIVEPIMGSNLYLILALPYLYYSLIVIGFVLLGIGIFRMVRKQ
jgi:hypothetical protein